MAKAAAPRMGRGVCLKCFVENDFQFLTPDGKRPRLCAIHDPGSKRRPRVEVPPSETEPVAGRIVFAPRALRGVSARLTARGGLETAFQKTKNGREV